MRWMRLVKLQTRLKIWQGQNQTRRAILRTCISQRAWRLALGSSPFGISRRISSLRVISQYSVQALQRWPLRPIRLRLWLWRMMTENLNLAQTPTIFVRPAASRSFTNAKACLNSSKIYWKKTKCRVNLKTMRQISTRPGISSVVKVSWQWIQGRFTLSCQARTAHSWKRAQVFPNYYR